MHFKLKTVVKRRIQLIYNFAKSFLQCVYSKYICHSEAFFREGEPGVFPLDRLFKQQHQTPFRAGSTSLPCNRKRLFVLLSDDAFLYRFSLKLRPQGGA